MARCSAEPSPEGKRESWAAEGLARARGRGTGGSLGRRSRTALGMTKRRPLRVQEEWVGPEHPRVAALDEAGDRDHPEGQARHRVERAHVDGAALLGLEGEPLPLEAGLEDFLHLGPARARCHRVEAAEVGDHLEDRLLVALGGDPLVADRAQPLDPLRPRGLAGQAVERPAEQLHDPQQRLRVRHVPQPPLAAIVVSLRLGRLALRLCPRAQAENPAAEAGDDPGLAAQLVPARGSRGGVGPQQLRERDGSEGQELHHRLPLETAAAEEQEERPRRAPEAQGQRGVEAMGNAEAGQQVGEEGGVGLGAGQDDAHVLEAHAAGGLAQQPPHDRPDLRGLAGGGHELDGAVVTAGLHPGGRRLEEALAQAPQRGGRVGRGQGGERGLAPLGLAHAAPGQPLAEGRAAQRRGHRPTQDAHGEGRGERGHELDLDGVELQVVRDQDLGPVEPARAREALARGGEQRHGIGGAALERAVEAAVEAGEGGEPARVVGSGRRARRQGGETLRRDPAATQGGEGARERGRHRRARGALGEAQPGAPALREQPRGDERVVAARPGREAPPEQDRLGQRTREVERLHRVDAGEGAAGRGEPPRQLHRGGDRRREEDEGAQGQGGEGDSSTRLPGPGGWAIIAAWIPSSGSSTTSSGWSATRWRS